ALIESRGGPIKPDHLHLQPGAGSPPAQATVPASEGEIPLNLEEAERWLIRRGIERAGGNISEAARLLGTNRSRIYRALGAGDSRPPQ
ncbi:MAG: helix-turn-helix domain-containing protein, partial [Gemmatimonadota bacterium]